MKNGDEQSGHKDRKMSWNINERKKFTKNDKDDSKWNQPFWKTDRYLPGDFYEEHARTRSDSDVDEAGCAWGTKKSSNSFPSDREQFDAIHPHLRSQGTKPEYKHEHDLKKHTHEKWNIHKYQGLGDYQGSNNRDHWDTRTHGNYMQKSGTAGQISRTDVTIRSAWNSGDAYLGRTRSSLKPGQSNMETEKWSHHEDVNYGKDKILKANQINLINTITRGKVERKANLDSKSTMVHNNEVNVIKNLVTTPLNKNQIQSFSEDFVDDASELNKKLKNLRVTNLTSRREDKMVTPEPTSVTKMKVMKSGQCV